jgi:hypothetical protein
MANRLSPVWSNLKRSLANLTKHNISQLTTLVKTRLRRMQYGPGLLAPLLDQQVGQQPGRPASGARWPGGWSCQDPGGAGRSCISTARGALCLAKGAGEFTGTDLPPGDGGEHETRGRSASR